MYQSRQGQVVGPNADDPVAVLDSLVAALDSLLKYILDPADYEEFLANMAQCDYDPDAAARSF